jgi:periplasmic protein TonB
MAPHVDTFDQPERLRGSFAGSLIFHAALVLGVGGVTVLQNSGPTFGVEKGGRAGTVSITPVASIPLPTNNAPPNPVATDTPSQVPTPKAPPKPVAKPKPIVKPPDPDAIPIKGGYTKKQYAQAPDKYRQQEKDVPNQIYSNSGRQLSSEMFAIQGSGKMGLGENAPFGNQFGAYAEILRNLVAGKWRTQDIDPRLRTAPQVIVTFTLHRNGSVTNLHVSQSSGIAPLDRSAQRAILDASPFPQMPPQFPKDQTDIDFVFELKR